MTKQNGNGRITDDLNSVVAYASVADFGDVFLSNTSRLYLLAYLMTGEHEMAERCFVEGIDHCIDGNPVFKKWAQSWVRRSIVKNAIRMISLKLETRNERSNKDDGPVLCRLEKDDLLQSLIELKRFERCVFVMSVLERFSDYECSLLLSRTPGEVVRGRRSAIEHLISVCV